MSTCQLNNLASWGIYKITPLHTATTEQIWNFHISKEACRYIWNYACAWFLKFEFIHCTGQSSESSDTLSLYSYAQCACYNHTFSNEKNPLSSIAGTILSGISGLTSPNLSCFLCSRMHEIVLVYSYSATA